MTQSLLRIRLDLTSHSQAEIVSQKKEEKKEEEEEEEEEED